MTDSGCQQCKENTYSGDGASSCTSCSDGKLSNAGSSSVEDCKGKFVHYFGLLEFYLRDVVFVWIGLTSFLFSILVLF